MGDIFREVDEELRQERYEKLWQQYGRYVIYGAAAIVLVFGGWQGWTHYEKAQRESASAQYAAAIRLAAENKTSEADAILADLIGKGGGSYAVLARFHRAALKAKTDDLAAAAAAYRALSDDSSLDESLRHAALVYSVSHEMDAPGADPKALGDRLSAAIAGDSAWRHSARELSGLIALKAGDDTQAKEHFQKLADDLDAPVNMRTRATQMISVLGG